MHATYGVLIPLAAAGLVPGPVAAQPEEADGVDEITVSATPLRSAPGLARAKFPYNVQSAASSDLERMLSVDLTDFLSRSMESISVNDAQNNPLQPDLRYRGFTASPLLGLAQGLAVYQNGARVNEPLGDTVNWDLLPAPAIHRLHLIGGANPLYGLNTLGGALAIEMKDGFSAPGHRLDLRAGSWGRRIASVETGGNRNGAAWYLNAHRFEEDGWRDLSPSAATNVYGSVGWQGERASVALNAQLGDSDLVGNGAAPVELLRARRAAIFTAPDETDNRMRMLGLEGNLRLSDGAAVAGSAWWRRNRTRSFNGDASEFAVCTLGGSPALLEGLERDDLEELGLTRADVCEDRFADVSALEAFLDLAAAEAGEDEAFDIDDLTGTLSGTGTLADGAVNNLSRRVQRSTGADLQLSLDRAIAGRPARSIVGAAWVRGETAFDARLELSALDPDTRSTEGLGTGTFVDDAATHVDTETETTSAYATTTLDLGDTLALTVSARYNFTRVRLKDRSGVRPELNGRHEFKRLNPALGLTWELTPGHSAYGSYSESSRAPTPIELACNDAIFELAAEFAEAAGEDPGEVDFECRLPNAFLADPPLEQVVARSFELGLRGEMDGLRYSAGLFHTASSDDIIFQTTGRATGLFANVDETRRRGFESGIEGSWEALDWFFAYSYVDATFRDSFRALSPNHPFANGDDDAIDVRAGDRIPGIPRHHVKAGGDLQFGDAVSVGLDARYSSGQYLRGDESNQLGTTAGYTVVNLRGRWQVTERLALYARVDNVLDAEYETFGLIGEDPSEVDVPALRDFTDPRFLGPGSPRAAYVGLLFAL